MWKVAETIGDKEGRLDICVVAHGVGGEAVSCLDFPGSVFQKASKRVRRGHDELYTCPRSLTSIPMACYMPLKRVADRWIALATEGVSFSWLVWPGL